LMPTPQKRLCTPFGTRGSQVQILPLRPAYQALSWPRKNRAQEIAQETRREAKRNAAERFALSVDFQM
jgi:hypothetical protein